MEAQQHPRKAQSSKHVQQKNDIHDQVAHLLGQLKASQSYDDLNESEQTEQTGSWYESEEITVVTLTHTSTNPRTMMIEPLYTNIAVVAMRSTRWPVDVASITEFDP